MTVSILSSNNYDLFHFFDSNRDVDHAAIIAKSIGTRNLTPYNPIMTCRINKKLYIIDGQNRFSACMGLGLPIYYVIVKDGRESDIMALNIGQRNWSVSNFIRHYAKKGRPDYQRMFDTVEKNNIKPTLVIGCIASKTKDIKAGLLRFSPEQQTKVQRVIDLYNRVSEYLPEDTGVTRFFAALFAVCDELDEKRIIRQFSKYETKIKKCYTTTDWKEMISYVYNYRRRGA